MTGSPLAVTTRKAPLKGNPAMTTTTRTEGSAPDLDVDLPAATAARIDQMRLCNRGSFPEFARVLEPCGAPAAGDTSLEPTPCPKPLLWAGMSDQYFSVIDALLGHEHIELAPADFLSSPADWSMLRLPLTAPPPTGGYKKPHWRPVVFVWTGPRPTPEAINQESRSTQKGSPADE